MTQRADEVRHPEGRNASSSARIRPRGGGRIGHCVSLICVPETIAPILTTMSCSQSAPCPG
jgi:hypothetical protein